MVMSDEACGLDMKNNMKPSPYNDIHHGHIPVPKPNNAEAMKTDHAKVMRQVMDAK
jgi:hypothetical protein